MPKRRKRVMFVVMLAVASGLLAGYATIEYLQARPSSVLAAQSNDTEPVVVAAREMGIGEVIAAEDVQIVQWPAGAVPAGYAGSAQEVVGRSLIGAVNANEALLASKLADTGLHGIVPLIPPGMRALSVRVDEVVGVAGFVTPQTRVDVILIMTPPGSGESVSKVILQNVQALAAGQQIRENAEGQPMTVTVVTVLVNPEQAEKLALAANQGRIQMALRNTLDLETIETAGMLTSRLFSGPPRTGGTVARSNPGPRTEEGILEMYRGGVRTLVSY